MGEVDLLTFLKFKPSPPKKRADVSSIRGDGNKHTEHIGNNNQKNKLVYADVVKRHPRTNSNSEHM